MISIARKNLFSEKFRFLISVGGVVFSTFLILTLLGIYAGITAQMIRYVEKTTADIWITEEGVTDMSHSSSFIPDSIKSQIERKIGGGRVYRLIARGTQLKIRPKGTLTTKRQREKTVKDENTPKAKVSLIGYDTSSGVGGAWKIREGKQTPGKKEIIIDALLAKNKRIRLGDNVEILNEDFTVVGISEETNFIVQQMVFINFDEAQDLFSMEGSVNYYLVQLDQPESRFEIKEKLDKEIPNISVRTKREWANKSAELVTETFVPIIFVIVIIGFLVGTVVVGLTIYTTTMEKIREYGILKAIGATNKTLYAIVFEQSLWTVSLGFLGGSILTLLFAPSIERYTAIGIILSPFTFIQGGVAASIMSLLASSIPIRRITGIDPVIVFKS